MPLEFIKPQLATSVDHPPPRAGWIHEVKHDGYRTLLIIERRKARGHTRNGFDWTERYASIPMLCGSLKTFSINCAQLVQDAVRQREFARRQILMQVGDRRGARDQKNVWRAMQQPRKRHL